MEKQLISRTSRCYFYIQGNDGQESPNLNLVVCCPDEIENLLLTLDVNKDHGPDNIHQMILCVVAFELVIRLSKLFNTMLDTQVVHDD